ncbi:MAG: GNAT family N-acetyltransferase [Xanthomonadales bacterium]|jgi:GNAT superfamily N-acetyltransferase|nr:GNAT family N-acetyltransferase [Xanthomonadales bacterium]
MQAVEWQCLPATAADIPALVELVESAYRGERSRAGWTTEADLLDGQRTDADSVAELISAPGHCLLTLRETDDILACCHLRRDGDTAHFGMFAVRPTRQAGGLGGHLLAAAETHALQVWRCTQMQMLVIDCRVELIAWYRRKGYAETGETQAFPYGNPRFGLPKRADLRFIRLAKGL